VSRYLFKGVPVECLATTPYLVIAIGFPVSILASRGYSEALRWMRDDPALGIFVTLILPIIAWFLIRNIIAFRAPWESIYRSRTYVSLAFCGVLGIFMVHEVWQDFVRDTAVPCYVFRHTGPTEDACIDDQRVRKAWTLWQEAAQQRSTASATQLPEYAPYFERLKDYRARWTVVNKSNGHLRLRWKDFSGVPYFSLAANYLGFMLALVFLWHCSTFLWLERPSKPIAARAIGILVLFLCWFPLRVYSETYVNFFDPNYNIAEKFVVFDGVAVLAFLTSVMLIFAYVREVSWTSLKATTTAALAIFTALALHNQDQRNAVVRWLSTDVPTSTFWFFSVLTLLVIGVIAIAGVSE
jgi:hypothetical protein